MVKYHGNSKYDSGLFYAPYPYGSPWMNRLRLENLTPEQKAQVCNGVGSPELGVMVPNMIFGRCADLHDFECWAGGPARLRWESDFRFFRNCLTASFHVERPLLIPVYCFISCVFYLALLLACWLVWEYADAPAQRWEEIQIRLDYYKAKHPMNPKVLARKFVGRLKRIV